MKKSLLTPEKQSKIDSLIKFFEAKINDPWQATKEEIKEIQKLDNEIKSEIIEYISQFDTDSKEDDGVGIVVLSILELPYHIEKKSFLRLLKGALKQSNISILINIIPDLCEIIGVPRFIKAIIMISRSNEDAYVFYLVVKQLKVRRWTAEQYKQFIETIKTTELFTLFSKYVVRDFKEQDSEKKNAIQVLKNTLYSKITGQRQGIDRLCTVLASRQQSFSSEELKPITFLFVGPTGVGKTQLAKELAAANYDSSMVNLHMENYRLEHQATILLGAPPSYSGSNKKPLLASHCEKYLSGRSTSDGYKILKPCVWLLDEFEKLHKNSKDIFLGILDEGKWSYKNATTEDKFCFKNCVFIATSNWLSPDIVQMFEKGVAFDDIEAKFVKLNERVQSDPKSFAPELLGRFNIIPFLPLTEPEQLQVVGVTLDQEIKDIKFSLRLKDISFKDKKEEEKIKHLINKNFYARMRGVSIRTLNSKIKAGIKGCIAASDVSLENAEIKICTNEDSSKLIAEVWKESDILLEAILIKEIELSSALIQSENRIRQLTPMNSSASSSSSSSSYSPHFIKSSLKTPGVSPGME